MTEQSTGNRTVGDEEKRRLIASTRRFDLRRILGALFLLYGVLTTIVGIVQPDQDVAKTGGIAINLWTGIAMLVVGALFLIWDRLSPVPEQDIVKTLEEPDANEAAAEAEEHPMDAPRTKPGSRD
ncbi:MAG TPA: hypothetical protein VIG76_09230 [Amnibacterium sp.]|jgi:hypothetical protein|uniref:hypothetical protein n=1 Tax=Amnibacterium sp. TaxID=1872496 RepID=UPI002F91CD95